MVATIGECFQEVQNTPAIPVRSQRISLPTCRHGFQNLEATKYRLMVVRELIRRLHSFSFEIN
jgi:hypothetical protein